MKKLLCVLALIWAGMMAFAYAEPASPATVAEDITLDCKISVSANTKYRKRMLNEKLDACWPCKQGDTIEIKMPAGKKAQGICVSFIGEVPELTVTQGERVIGTYQDRYYTGYVAFDECCDDCSVTVRGEGAYKINRLRVFSEGILPKDAQRWTDLDGPADIMLVATHPDDEILWFGGMLPTYAGERQLKVIVVNMVGNDTQRRLEYLNGLWTCGVRYYPEIGSFPDRSGRTPQSTLSLWGEEEPTRYITRLIRKYKPRIVVTQDIDGEYGHAHHKVTVQAVIDAVTRRAPDPSWDPESAEQYGDWTPKGLYLHLWNENVIDFDWGAPLEAFDGETSLSVARRAFRQHVSQQKGKYHVNESGKLDSSLFGLYWSGEGPEVDAMDLFEGRE